MSNATTAIAGTRKERPPVLGSCWPSGIVSRITSFLAGVLSPVVADLEVLAPVVSPVLAPVASPVVVPVVPSVVVPVVLVPVVSVVPVVVPCSSACDPLRSGGSLAVTQGLVEAVYGLDLV
jgi:hypothetical protein